MQHVAIYTLQHEVSSRNYRTKTRVSISTLVDAGGRQNDSRYESASFLRLEIIFNKEQHSSLREEYILHMISSQKTFISRLLTSLDVR